MAEGRRRRWAARRAAAGRVRERHDEGGHGEAGLFEACLAAGGSGLSLSGAAATPADLADALGREVTETGPGCAVPETLLLLLRSSGDERAERSRLGTLCALGERLAAAAGRGPGDAEGLLRAQLLLAAAVGVGMLRSTGGPEPLASATEDDLAAPLRDLVAALLPETPPR